MLSNFNFIIKKDSEEYDQIQEILKQENKSFEIKNLTDVLKEDEDMDGIDPNNIVNPEIGKVLVFDNGLKFLLNTMYKTEDNKIELISLDNDLPKEISDIKIRLHDINSHHLCSLEFISKEE